MPSSNRLGTQALFRVCHGGSVPHGWRIVRILQTLQVPNNDGGAGWHYEYDVLAEGDTA